MSPGTGPFLVHASNLLGVVSKMLPAVRIRSYRPAFSGAQGSSAEFDFVSALAHDNITGFRYRPERSADLGLQVYANFAVALELGAAQPSASCST